jgi:hypothetical protein
MTGHGCGCGRSSCNVCTLSHRSSCTSWGKDVFYGNDNLRRFFVSCGENFDAIIEKAFNFTADVKELFLEFEQETLEKFTSITVELNAIKIRLAALEAAGGGGTVDLTDILADIAALQGQMTTVINNIGTLSNLTTTAKTNLVAAINEIDADLTALSTKIGDLSTLTTTNKTSVVNAINEVNAKVPVLGTLNNLPGVVTQATNFTDAINDRQPVWKKSLNVTVGSSQAAPFNTIDSAINELAKYHFDSNLLTIKLEDGTHTITPAMFHRINTNSYTLESLSGNRANCILTSTGATINNGLQYAEFKNLTIKGAGTSTVVSTFSNNGHTILNNCIVETGVNNTSAVIASESGYLRMINCKIVNKATAAINFVKASDMGKIITTNLEVDNSAGNANSNLYLAQVNSDIEVIYSNPVSTTVVNNINTVYTTYLNSKITILSFGEFTYSNIGYGFIVCQDGSSIIHRAQNSLGVNLNTNVTGRSLTSGGSFATILGAYTNSSVNTTKITANTFNRGMYLWENSKLTGNIAISNVVHGLWLDRNSSLQVNGSIATTGNQGLIIANNSAVVTDDLQVSGQSAAAGKVLMTNASRLSRNNTGSNIGSDVFFSGSGNIVTG